MFVCSPSRGLRRRLSFHFGSRQADRAMRHFEFPIAESLGFKGGFRQWQELLRIGD